MLSQSRDENSTAGINGLEFDKRIRGVLSDISCTNFHAEPHVEMPQRRNSISNNNAMTQMKRAKKMSPSRNAPYDALEALGKCADNSKEHIDALEKLLHNAMPSRIVLDSVLMALRNAVADDIERGQEAQWTSGVNHGMWVAGARIEELEAQAAQIPNLQDELLRNKVNNITMQSEYTKLLDTKTDWWHGTDNTEFPFKLPPMEEVDYAFDPKENVNDDIDIDAMTRETESLLNLIECSA